jgi:N-acetylglucosamine kinase-like BadF-type ATPase
MREVIGIDIGGTKTHLAVGVGMEVVKERIMSTPAWRTHAIPHNAAALQALVRDWLGDPAMRWPLAVGAHGCDNTQQCDEFAAELRQYFGGEVQVVNDAELLVPAMGLASGIGLIAGTGSIAVARDAAGRLLTAGGWGWVLGDEGSASGLVREATRAVLDALDQGLPPDPLGRRLLAAFGAGDGAELAMAVTTATWCPGRCRRSSTARCGGACSTRSTARSTPSSPSCTSSTTTSPGSAARRAR